MTTPAVERTQYDRISTARPLDQAELAKRQRDGWQLMSRDNRKNREGKPYLVYTFKRNT
jgi:hypothetical protein